MNATTESKDREAPWKIYGKAAAFLLPPLIIWLAVSSKSVPVFLHIVENARFETAKAEWIWHFSMFLVENGLYIMALIAGLVLALELSGRNWAPYRRNAVGTLVWIVNFTILFGLACLFTLAVIAFPNLR